MCDADGYKRISERLLDMETQDVQVGRINDLKGAQIDQAALIRLQQELSARNRGESTLSKDSRERLKNMENLMSQILEELVTIRKLLASSRGEKVVNDSAISG